METQSTRASNTGLTYQWRCEQRASNASRHQIVHEAPKPSPLWAQWAWRSTPFAARRAGRTRAYPGGPRHHEGALLAIAWTVESLDRSELNGLGQRKGRVVSSQLYRFTRLELPLPYGRVHCVQALRERYRSWKEDRAKTSDRTEASKRRCRSRRRHRRNATVEHGHALDRSLDCPGAVRTSGSPPLFLRTALPSGPLLSSSGCTSRTRRFPVIPC